MAYIFPRLELLGENRETDKEYFNRKQQSDIGKHRGGTTHIN